MTDSPTSQAAKGLISCTTDLVTQGNTGRSFIGGTLHWITEQDGKWVLRTEMLGYQRMWGTHTGQNIARHLTAMLNRIGVFTEDYGGNRV